MSSDGLAIVLAAHGAPAIDYPPMRVGLLMMLEFAGKKVERIGVLRSWRDRLAYQASGWPRTPENDPYKAAVDELADQLADRLGCPVLAAYNEFCVPAIGEAIDQAIAGGALKVVVVPTMLVRGNPHTELEIREAVTEAKERHSSAEVIYAWPFQEGLLVSMLAKVVTSRLPRSPMPTGEEAHP